MKFENLVWVCGNGCVGAFECMLVGAFECMFVNCVCVVLD